MPETPDRDRAELTLQLALGPVLLVSTSQGGQQIEHAYTRAQQLALALGDTRQLFHALAGLRRFHTARGHHQHAREIGERLLAVAQQMEDPALLMEAHFSLATSLVLMGEFPTARVHLEQALVLYDTTQARSQIQLHGVDPSVLAGSYLMLTLWVLGYADEAEQRRREAFARAEALGHAPSSAHLGLFTCVLYHWQRNVPALQEQATAVVTLTSDHGLPSWLAGGVAMQGWVRTMQEQGAAGIALIQQGLHSLRTIGQRAWLSYFLALLAEGYGCVGQPADGLRTVAEAFDLIEQTGERFYEAELWRIKGELTLQKFQVSSFEF